MKRFRAVAEKPIGIFHGSQRVRNPFLIRDVFDPNLKERSIVREWDDLEAKSEAELRRRFAELQAEPGDPADLRGFRITSITEITPAVRSLAPPGFEGAFFGCEDDCAPD